MSRRVKSPPPKSKGKKKSSGKSERIRTRSPPKKRSRSRSRSPQKPRRGKAKKKPTEEKAGCLDVTAGDNVADMTLEWALTPSERNVLLQLRPLYVRWGYRTGQNEQHQKYELLTHGCCRVLQEYTDILFRNLQQFITGSPRIFESDVIDKVRNAPDLQIYNPDMALQSTKLLETYFADENIKNQFLAFAGQDLWREPHSAGYVGMVSAARAIVCIWLGNYRTAKAHLQAFLEQYNELRTMEAQENENDNDDEFEQGLDSFSFW